MFETTSHFQRLLNMVFYIQAHPGIKAVALSKRYNASMRQIERDINYLEGAGVPIYAERGFGYHILNRWKHIFYDEGVTNELRS